MYILWCFYINVYTCYSLETAPAFCQDVVFNPFSSWIPVVLWYLLVATVWSFEGFMWHSEQLVLYRLLGAICGTSGVPCYWCTCSTIMQPSGSPHRRAELVPDIIDRVHEKELRVKPWGVPLTLRNLLLLDSLSSFTWSTLVSLYTFFNVFLSFQFRQQKTNCTPGFSQVLHRW